MYRAQPHRQAQTLGVQRSSAAMKVSLTIDHAKEAGGLKEILVDHLFKAGSTWHQLLALKWMLMGALHRGEPIQGEFRARFCRFDPANQPSRAARI